MTCLSGYSSVCVERLIWVQEAVGSNPATRTINTDIMELVLDGFEGWSYKPVHKVQLLGALPFRPNQL